MLGPIQHSQESFLRGGFNFNHIGRLGLSTLINIVCYHPISSMIDRLETRLQTIEKSKKIPRKVIAFSSLTLLFNIVQVKTVFGPRLGLVASVAAIVTLTALMTLKYIYDKTQGSSSPAPNNLSPASSESSEPGFQFDFTFSASDEEAVDPNHGFFSQIDEDPSLPQPIPTPTVIPPTPAPSNPLNKLSRLPLGLVLLPTLQQSTSDNILTDEQYRVLENALHCTRETLNYLFIGLRAEKDTERKNAVLRQLQQQSAHLTKVLSSRNLLPEGQNREGAYLDENMKKLFVYYIEEFMQQPLISNSSKTKVWYEQSIRNMMNRFPNQDQSRLIELIFLNNDSNIYEACHFADNCVYTSEELREFVRFFIPNPTADQAFIILTTLRHAGRIIQKHQSEPERTGCKTPSDPGLKNRVMNFFIMKFKQKIYDRPQGKTGITVFEFKMFFKEITKEYGLLDGKSNKFIGSIRP